MGVLLVVYYRVNSKIGNASRRRDVLLHAQRATIHNPGYSVGECFPC